MKYKVVGACPLVLIGGKEVTTGETFEALEELVPADRLAFWTQIGAVEAVFEAEPEAPAKPARVAEGVVLKPTPFFSTEEK